jgi:type III secretion protein T
MGMGRNVIVFAVALPLFHVLYPTLPRTQIPLLILFARVCKGVIIGAMLGFLSGFICYVTDNVEFIRDIQRRSLQAMTFDPGTSYQTSLLGSFLTQMIVTLFFSMEGFLFFLGVIYENYITWPVLTFFSYI